MTTKAEIALQQTVDQAEALLRDHGPEIAVAWNEGGEARQKVEAFMEDLSAAQAVLELAQQRKEGAK